MNWWGPALTGNLKTLFIRALRGSDKTIIGHLTLLHVRGTIKLHVRGTIKLHVRGTIKLATIPGYHSYLLARMSFKREARHLIITYLKWTDSFSIFRNLLNLDRRTRNINSKRSQRRFRVDQGRPDKKQCKSIQIDKMRCRWGMGGGSVSCQFIFRLKFRTRASLNLSSRSGSLSTECEQFYYIWIISTISNQNTGTAAVKDSRVRKDRIRREKTGKDGTRHQISWTYLQDIDQLGYHIMLTHL